MGFEAAEGEQGDQCTLRSLAEKVQAFKVQVAAAPITIVSRATFPSPKPSASLPTLSLDLNMPSGEAPAAVEVPWHDGLQTAPMPVIDYAALASHDPATHAAELARLEEVARSVGFFYLRYVPIERPRLDAQFALAKQLFELPFEEKEPLNMGIKGEFGGLAPLSETEFGQSGIGRSGPLAKRECS